uniref:CNGC5-like protein n=1 Tax=Steinernema glaseri TaxID=37863 RepID=A0A1I8AV03_9BILA
MALLIAYKVCSKKAEWISEHSKEKLKNIHTIDDFIFGPPEAFLNESMVQKALKIYQEFFRGHWMFTAENMKRTRHKCTTNRESTIDKQICKADFISRRSVGRVGRWRCCYSQVPEELHMRCFIVAGIQLGGRS